MERGWIRTSIVRGGPRTVGEDEREGGLLGAQDANLVEGRRARGRRLGRVQKAGKMGEIILGIARNMI